MSAKISKCLCRNLFIGATAQIRDVYKDHKILVTLKREGELDLFYYSCKEHLDELIEVLRKHGDDEEELLTTFEERYDEIIRHMNVTQDLYAEKQGNLIPILLKPRESGKLVESKDFEKYRETKKQEQAEDEKKRLLKEEADFENRKKTCPRLRFVGDGDVKYMIKPSREPVIEINNDFTKKKETAHAETLLEVAVASLLGECIEKVVTNLTNEGKKDQLVEEIVKEFQLFKEEIKIKNTVEAAVEIDEAEAIKLRAEEEQRKKEEELITARLLSNIEDLTAAIMDATIPIEIEKSNEEDIKQKEEIRKPVAYFKLGTISSQYENQYACNELAKGKHDIQFEKDKRRVLAYKFCLNDFKWNGEIKQSLSSFKAILRTTLIYFESSLPTAFLHPNWYRLLPCWIKAVRCCDSVEDFVCVLLLLEKMIKPVIQVNVWKEGCGIIKLHRALMEAKSKEKIKTRPGKKDREKELSELLATNLDDSGSEDEEINVTRKTPKIPVKYKWIPKHTIWEQKGEEYRLAGVGAWLWHCHHKRRVKKKINEKKEEELFQAKKQRIEYVLRKVKVKKGTQYVKKDRLNVIYSKPSEYDKRDMKIGEEIEEECEGSESPLSYIKRTQPCLFKTGKEFSLPFKFLGNRFSGEKSKYDEQREKDGNTNTDGVISWYTDTEMEIIRPSETITKQENDKVSTSMQELDILNSVGATFPAISCLVTQPRSTSTKIILQKDTDAIIPVKAADIAQEGQGNQSQSKSEKVSDKSVLSISNKILKTVPDKNIYLQQVADTVPAPRITTTANSTSTVIISTTQENIKINHFSAPMISTSKKEGNSKIGLVQRNTLPSNITVNHSSMQMVTRDNDSVGDVISTSSPVPLPSFLINGVVKDSYITNCQPITTIASDVQTPGSVIHSDKVDNNVNTLQNSKLASFNNPNIIPKSIGHAKENQIPICHMKVPSVNTPIMSSLATANKNIRLQLPQVLTTKTPNSQPVIMNNHQGIPLIQALAAAGIKPVDGSVVTFQRDTGRIFVRPPPLTQVKQLQNKGNAMLSSQSTFKITRMPIPTSAVVPSSNLLGLSQVRPKTQIVAPNIASLTKIVSQKTPPPTAASTSSTNVILQKNINTKFSKATHATTQTVSSATATPKLTTTKHLPYSEEFYNKSNNRIKYIGKVYESPDVLLKTEAALLLQRCEGVKSIFYLPKHQISKVARKAGMTEVNGFLYNCKPSSTWPEGVPRPCFQVIWRYRLSKAKQLSTVAHLFRILHCCLKWDVMTTKPPKGVKRAVTSNKGIMTIEILEGEPLAKDGLRYKYKVRKNYQPFKLKKPKPERPPSPPPMDLTPKARGSALGIKLRERTAPLKYTVDKDLETSSSEDEGDEPFPREKCTIDSWVNEDSLDPWEIRQYWEKVEHERAVKENYDNNKTYVNSKHKVILPTQRMTPIVKMVSEAPSVMKKVIVKSSPNTTVIPSSVPLGPQRQPLQTIKPKVTSTSINVMHNVLLNKYINSVSSNRSRQLNKKIAMAVKGRNPSQVKNGPTQPSLLASKLVPEDQNLVLHRKGSNVRVLPGKKMYADPVFYCVKSVLESVMKKIESTEKKELKKLEKYKASLQKQQQQEQFRMKNLLEDRKVNLKMQILRKRELLEKLTIRQVQKEIQEVLGIAGSHVEEKNG